MSAGPSGALTGELVVLALFVLIIVRRTVRLIQGAPYSTARMFGFAAVYVLLFVALAFSTLYSAVVFWGSAAYVLLLPYVAVPVLAGFLAVPYVRRVVRFEPRENGQLYYRLSWHIPVLYLVLFLGRLAAEVVVLGPSALILSFPPPAPPSDLAVEALIGVDLLFGVSLGLLLGRGVGVYLAHKDLPSSDRGESPPPSPPLPSR